MIRPHAERRDEKGEAERGGENKKGRGASKTGHPAAERRDER